MNKKSQKRILVTLFFIASFFYYIPSTFAAYEIDMTSYVIDVIDGHSFFIIGHEVRLADISCPELYEKGGQEALDALTDLIEGKIVYLDTDQYSGRDPYGRLIAVVYIPFNETHLANINEFMWSYGFADLTDYSNNEFDPSLWMVFERIEIVEQENPDSIDAYNELLLEYAELYTDFESIVIEYNELEVDYKELLIDLDEVEVEYSELEVQYGELETICTELEERVVELENMVANSGGIPGFPLFVIILGACLGLLQIRISSQATNGHSEYF